MCCLFSIQLLYFMGDPIAGELIFNVRKISHDKAQLSQHFETMNSKSFPGDVPLYWMMRILILKFQYSITEIDESMIQLAKDMITIGQRCHLPMILSVGIHGPKGMVSTNHVVGVYNGMIIDGECCHARLLNEQNLHQSCGDETFFVGVVRGYLMLPPKSRLSLKNTLPDDKKFMSSGEVFSNESLDFGGNIKYPLTTQTKKAA